jgi:hypothetical protein
VKDLVDNGPRMVQRKTWYVCPGWHHGCCTHFVKRLFAVLTSKKHTMSGWDAHPYEQGDPSAHSVRSG